MGKTYEHLSLEERNEISVLHRAGKSYRKIATALGRSASTISREMKRNILSKVNGYKPLFAHEQAWGRRWKGSRLERHSALRDYVLKNLAMGLSPEQIAGRMRLEKHSIRISYESIYRFIYQQISRHQNFSWRHYLPYAKYKRGYRGKAKCNSVLNIKERVSIHERPDYIEQRSDVGHWEADLMMFYKKKHNLLVSIERKTRYVMLSLQSSKETIPTIKHLHKNLKTMPKEALKTITFDNGNEFAHHYKLKRTLGIQTYFCDTHSPWQKGSVENMNKRLRRFLPKKTNLDNLTHRDIHQLQFIINNTPRKCLGFLTPHEALHKALHFNCESTASTSSA
jgi:transposase, IS30 family